MSNHTPGPWGTAVNGSFKTQVRSARGRRVAETWVQGPAKSREGALNQAKVNEANALLIAAAPDLLEALRACEKQAEEVRLILINHLNEPERTAFWKAINIREFCRGAIAKAEGQS